MADVKLIIACLLVGVYVTSHVDASNYKRSKISSLQKLFIKDSYLRELKPGNIRKAKVTDVGLQCDGITCISVFTSCCYFEPLHHWTCCSGDKQIIPGHIWSKEIENKKQSEKNKNITSAAQYKGKVHGQDQAKAIHIKHDENKAVQNNNYKGLENEVENKKVIRQSVGLECDGIKCSPAFTSCCYSALISHNYCC